MNILKTLSQALKRLCPCKGTPKQGSIKFYDRKKRFGFIIAGEDEYFFHATSLKNKDFRGMRDGAKVSFVVTQGKKGPQADKIELLP